MSEFSDLEKRRPNWGKRQWLEFAKLQTEDLAAARAEIGLLSEKLPCGHRKVDMDDSYGGCVFCGFKDGYEEYEAQLEQIAKLAKWTLDGKMADGEEWNTLNAIYWHAIGEAEPEPETTKDNGGTADAGQQAVAVEETDYLGGSIPSAALPQSDKDRCFYPRCDCPDDNLCPEFKELEQ